MRKMLPGLLAGLCLTIWLSDIRAQMLPLRKQADLIDTILEERMNRILPVLMEKNGIGCWVIISREYNEDPVLKTFLPAEWMSARRRTMLLFFYDSLHRRLEKLAVTRYDVGRFMKSCWDTRSFPDQWDALVDLIVRKAPGKIAIDTSVNFAHADGLDHTDYVELTERLPAAYRSRVVSAEPLAVGWLETRTEHEMQLYPQLIAYTHRIIAEAFSPKVIIPGRTTPTDVEWWLRQRIRDDGYDTWFHPSVTIQRSDSAVLSLTDAVILPGDLLHVDFGVSYLRLNTDVQEHAYVLRPGEKNAPVGLRNAFMIANRLQDILTEQFAAGRTGNELLAAALTKARAEGIRATIYAHPIGFHGHGAGPAIGLWDHQEGVAGSGDYPLHYETAYSIELSATARVTEWGKDVRMMLEEDGYYGKQGFRYIDGRQRAIYLISPL